MSNLIQQFKGRTVIQWEEWYIKQYPEAIKNATAKIWQMVGSLKQAMDKIDKEMVKRWVKDLVIVKSFLGLKFQEAILKKGADIKKTCYRLAEPSDESQGIDGYIGETAVSIKPDTYQVKKALPETLPVKIIYYKELKDGIEVDYREVL